MGRKSGRPGKERFKKVELKKAAVAGENLKSTSSTRRETMGMKTARGKLTYKLKKPRKISSTQNRSDSQPKKEHIWTFGRKGGYS